MEKAEFDQMCEGFLKKALVIAARETKRFNQHLALRRQVTELRRAGKHDEANALKEQFAPLNNEGRQTFRDADAFRKEVEAHMPDPEDRKSFVFGVERRAVGNTFVMLDRAAGEKLNLASQVMWVVAPWKKDVFSFLRMRHRTGSDVTAKDIAGTKRLIAEGERYLKGVAEEMPDIEEVAAGNADFASQQVTEEFEEVQADLSELKVLLAKMEKGAARKAEARKSGGTPQDRRGDRGDHNRQQESKPDPIAELEGELKGKNDALNALMREKTAESLTKAAALTGEIAEMQKRLEEMRAEKAREEKQSGYQAMAVEAPPRPGEGEPMGSAPQVKGDAEAAKTKAGDIAGKVETYKAEIEKFVAEIVTMQEALEKTEREALEKSKAARAEGVSDDYAEVLLRDARVLRQGAKATAAEIERRTKAKETAEAKLAELEAQVKAPGETASDNGSKRRERKGRKVQAAAAAGAEAASSTEEVTGAAAPSGETAEVVAVSDKGAQIVEVAEPQAGNNGHGEMTKKDVAVMIKASAVLRADSKDSLLALFIKGKSPEEVLAEFKEAEELAAI